MTDQNESTSGSPKPPGPRILCPVRGGKRSAGTVDRAVELALESSGSLVFLYIVDVDFLGFATVARVKLMAEELAETGRFAMSILAEKARAQGLEQVDTITREGKIQEVIISVAAETQATGLVIGRPMVVPGVPSFSAHAFESLVQDIAQATGLDIECV